MCYNMYMIKRREVIDMFDDFDTQVQLEDFVDDSYFVFHEVNE